MENSIAIGIYQHTKTGKRYQVLGTALHTETDELLVIYKPLYECKYELFARPLSMFKEEVCIKGVAAKRFEKVE